MDKQKHIEELEKDIGIAFQLAGTTRFGAVAEILADKWQRKIPENAVVLTREEYDELVNLQQTHLEELTNAIQSYEEDKADLKINYDNHIKNLEKIIDRQSKDLNTQANRLIDLKAELEKRNPNSLTFVALLDKPSRRKVKFDADYVGKTIEDLFVVGFGLDYNEKYRNLKDVCVLEN